MQRYEMLRNNLYSTDLLYGKIELKPTHTFSCFFIVEHTFDVEFIKNQAIQLLLAGCQEFDFYGKAEPQWHSGVNEASILLHPVSTPETVTLISRWSDLEEFVDILNERLFERPFVPHDFYLLYDDEGIYRNVLKMLNAK